MNSLSMPLETFSGKAACNRNKSEDLPCTIFITAFEEKALSLMKRANRPIISFIHSASKKVRNNKLCQVYLNGVRSKGFRPDILFCNFPKTNFIIRVLYIQ